MSTMLDNKSGTVKGQSIIDWLNDVFGVRRLLRNSRCDFARILMADADQWHLSDEKDAAKRSRMLEDIENGSFHPDLDWILSFQLLYISQLRDFALDSKLDKAVASIRSLGGDQAVQTWMNDRRNVPPEYKKDFLKEVTKELFSIYNTRTTIEKIRAKLLFVVLASAISFAILLGVLYHVFHIMALFLCICGLAGATLSIYQRITKMSDYDIDMKQLATLMHAPHGLFVSMAFGTLCPMLGVILISSGIIHSSFLPRLDSVEFLRQSYSAFKIDYSASAAHEFTHYIAAAAKATNGDLNLAEMTEKIQEISSEEFDHLANMKVERTFSKLLMLGLLCGFSERFIHDAIDSFMKRFGKQTPKRSAGRMEE